VLNTLKVAIEPNRRVTGMPSTPRNGALVLVTRFTPKG
jgi:hypothetical protein